MASGTAHAPSIPSLPTTPILTLAKTLVRPYHPTDSAASSKQANDWEIARWMRNTFPHPYELQNAEFFINTIALTNKSASPLKPEVSTSPPLLRSPVCCVLECPRMHHFRLRSRVTDTHERVSFSTTPSADPRTAPSSAASASSPSQTSSPAPSRSATGWARSTGAGATPARSLPPSPHGRSRRFPIS